MHGSIEVYWFINEGLESCREEILRNLLFFFPISACEAASSSPGTSSICSSLGTMTSSCSWSKAPVPDHSTPPHLAVTHDTWLFGTCLNWNNMVHLARVVSWGAYWSHTVSHTMDIVPSAVREHWLPATISGCYCALSVMVMKATLPQRMQQCLDDNFSVVVVNVLIL